MSFQKIGVRGAVYLPIKSAWIPLATGSRKGNHSGAPGIEGRGELGENDAISLGKIRPIHFPSVEHTH